MLSIRKNVKCVNFCVLKITGLCGAVFREFMLQETKKEGAPPESRYTGVRLPARRDMARRDPSRSEKE